MSAITLQQPVRKCGKRSEGGVYLASPMGSTEGELPMFITLFPPIPVQRKAHRGPIVINGSALLLKLTEDQWLIGASANRYEKQLADRWAEGLFGMTSTKRLSTGECKGLTSVDDAISKIMESVVFEANCRPAIRSMTLSELHKLPNVGEPFSNLAQAIQVYLAEGKKDKSHLVYAVGHAWAMVEKAQPKSKTLVAEKVSNLLIYMGMKKDALEMRIKHGV